MNKIALNPEVLKLLAHAAAPGAGLGAAAGGIHGAVTADEGDRLAGGLRGAAAGGVAGGLLSVPTAVAGGIGGLGVNAMRGTKSPLGMGPSGDELLQAFRDIGHGTAAGYGVGSMGGGLAGSAAVNHFANKGKEAAMNPALEHMLTHTGVGAAGGAGLGVMFGDEGNRMDSALRGAALGGMGGALFGGGQLAGAQLDNALGQQMHAMHPPASMPEPGTAASAAALYGSGAPVAAAAKAAPKPKAAPKAKPAAAAAPKPKAKPKTKKTAAEIAYGLGQLDVIEALGIEKDAMLGGVIAAGKAGLNAAKPIFAQGMRGARLGGRMMGKGVSTGVAQGMNTLSKSAPGLHSGLQTAGKVLRSPYTQAAGTVAAAGAAV